MSSLFYSLKNLWVFRNKTNFLIFALGTSSTGFFIIKQNNEKKFQHPVVREAIRKLNKNEQIIELIGYPISLEVQLIGSSAISTKNVCNFSFLARGPRGNVNIELNGNSQAHKDIIAGDENQSQDGLSTKQDKLNKYYIPDIDLINYIEERKKQQADINQEQIPEDKRFWMIDYLFAEIAGDYRIVLVPEPQNKQKKQQQEIQVLVEKREKLIDVLKEQGRRNNSSINNPSTEEEIEDLRKYNLQEMYRKIGNVRNYMILMFALTGMSTYIYLRKNKRKNVIGTELYQMVMNQLTYNQQIKLKFGESIKFPQQVRGQWIDADAEFETDFYGPKGFGVAKVKGHFDSKANQWVLDQLEVYEHIKGELKNKMKLK